MIHLAATYGMCTQGDHLEHSPYMYANRESETVGTSFEVSLLRLLCTSYISELACSHTLGIDIRNEPVVHICIASTPTSICHLLPDKMAAKCASRHVANTPVGHQTWVCRKIWRAAREGTNFMSPSQKHNWWSSHPPHSAWAKRTMWTPKINTCQHESLLGLKAKLQN